MLLLYAVVFSGMPLVNFAVLFFTLCSFSVNFGTCPLTFHGKTCKIELFPEGSKPSFIQSCNHEVDFIERKTDTLDGKETDYLFVTLKNS